MMGLIILHFRLVEYHPFVTQILYMKLAVTLRNGKIEFWVLLDLDRSLESQGDLSNWLAQLKSSLLLYLRSTS